MAVTKLRDKVFWVGAVDWGLRDFHGYARAPRGTSYNAYLVLDEKVTLFDTVSGGFGDELLRRISGIVDPSDIDYLVVNHVEPDHSGHLPAVIEATKPEAVFCSAMGKQALLAHYHRPDWPYRVVGDGEVLRLGARSVQFMETKMLHWPDSMFSYLMEDRVLVSSDAFGQNIATSERFDDEVDAGILMEEAARYYANIVLPFSPVVRKVLERVTEMGWKIDLIAPDHGLVWRSRIPEILAAYERWSSQRSSAKAVVVYDTMWRSTERMALAVADGLGAEGMSVRVMSMKSHHHSDVMAEVLEAGAVVVGSPTHNNGMLPTMADMMTFMKGLKPRNLVGAAFGSHGWSGEAVKHLTDALREMKAEIVEPSPKVKYVPTPEDLEACESLGRAVASAVKAKLSAA